MITVSSEIRLRRTWRLSWDNEASTWEPSAAPIATLQRIDAKAITGALQTDGILLGGSVSWMLTRIEGIRSVGLCYVPLLAVANAPNGTDTLRLIECGADDVLVAPVDWSVVDAKLHALTRRTSGEYLSACPEVRLRPEAYTVEFCGSTIQLRPTPFRLFAYLFAHREQWVDKERILRDVFGLARDPGTSLIRVHIHAIRRGLGRWAACVRDDPGRNRGYMFMLRERAESASTQSGQ